MRGKRACRPRGGHADHPRRIRDDGGPEVFVHHSDIKMEGFRNLEAGQRVRFTIQDGPKGPQAREVQPLTRPVARPWPSSPAYWIGDR